VVAVDVGEILIRQYALGAQFLVLPALTVGLVWLVQPHPSIALGMILVAACPGGNISNFFDGLGGMAVVAAWWGVWHIVAGLALSSYWRLRARPLFAPRWTGS